MQESIRVVLFKNTTGSHWKPCNTGTQSRALAAPEPPEVSPPQPHPYPPRPSPVFGPATWTRKTQDIQKGISSSHCTCDLAGGGDCGDLTAAGVPGGPVACTTVCACVQAHVCMCVCMHASTGMFSGDIQATCGAGGPGGPAAGSAASRQHAGLGGTIARTRTRRKEPRVGLGAPCRCLCDRCYPCARVHQGNKHG